MTQIIFSNVPFYDSVNKIILTKSFTLRKTDYKNTKIIFDKLSLLSNIPKQNIRIKFHNRYYSYEHCKNKNINYLFGNDEFYVAYLDFYCKKNV